MFAQIPAGPTTPDIAWSAFAPELVLGSAAMVLLLLIVAERFRLLVAAPVGAGGVALGAWLVTNDLVFPGGVAVALGAGLVAIVIGLGALPRLVLPFTAALATAGALALTAGRPSRCWGSTAARPPRRRSPARSPSTASPCSPG
jgi:hypothetical protein